jgi:rubrerythrin
MSVTIDNLLSDFADELQKTNQRYSSFVKKAEDAGYSQLAKFIRAIVTSETAREKRFRCGMAHHSKEQHEYYICPHCGLVFLTKAPDQCPVDGTLGSQFERVN